MAGLTLDAGALIAYERGDERVREILAVAYARGLVPTPLAALMEDRFEYPDRTAFVAADSASFGSSFARAASEDRPVLIVMPDGVEFLYEPAPGLVASLRRRLRSRFAAHRLREMGPLVTDPSTSGWLDTDPVPIPGYRHRLRGPRPASAAS